MKQTKLLIAIGAAVLSVAGFVATKAGSKFAAFQHGKFINIATGSATLASSLSKLTSVKGAGARTVWLATRANTSSATILHTVVTVTNGAVQLYLKP